MFNRLEPNTRTMLALYDSAIVRYQRADPIGAADTIRNIARGINSEINFYKLEATPGTIQDAVAAYKGGRIRSTLKILKHIHLELHFGRLVV